MMGPLPLDLTATVVSTLAAAVVGAVAAIFTALLARPKQTAEVGKTDAEAAAARVSADTSLSTEARAWVQTFVDDARDSKARAVEAEKKEDVAEARADTRAEQLRRCRRRVRDLEDQLRREGHEPVTPPPGHEAI
jgi:gas vesicle protein